MKKEIKDTQDIQLLVDDFYARVREDSLLGPIFEAKVHGRWQEHLQTMYGFWENVLLGQNSYHGRPFPKHMSLPIGKEHFDQWVTLFKATLTAHFTGDKALEAAQRAEQISQVFQYKLTFLRQSPSGENA